MVGLFTAAKPCRAEEDYGVLNLFFSEAGKWLTIFRDDADQTPVGAVEKGGILISQGSPLERWRSSVAGKSSCCRRPGATAGQRLGIQSLRPWSLSPCFVGPCPVVCHAVYPSRWRTASWNAIQRFSKPRPDMMPRTAPLAA